MDIRRDGFFGYLTLNGKNLVLRNDTMLKGSIMSVIAESLKSLTAERSRGDVNIMLRISNKPIDTSEQGLANFNRITEVESLLDNAAAPDFPILDESYEDFYQRLLSQEYAPVAAEAIAAQWFEKPINPDTTLWLNDPKAVRFRELNARDEAFNNALPQEYESLKHYVQTTYPSFVEHITFRTA